MKKVNLEFRDEKILEVALETACNSNRTLNDYIINLIQKDLNCNKMYKIIIEFTNGEVIQEVNFINKGSFEKELKRYRDLMECNYNFENHGKIASIRHLIDESFIDAY